jgi:hypothetical protein
LPFLRNVQYFACLDSNERYPGLPDGTFANQKSKFWYILEGVGMENVGLFYCNFGTRYCDLVYFAGIGYMFSIFGVLYQEKSGNHGKDP